MPCKRRTCDVDGRTVLPGDSKALVEQMIPGRLVERFNREGEVDFSYAIKGVGRFRVNIFKQRGTMSFVIRLVNTEIPSPGITWPAAVRFGTGQEKAWSDFSYRTDRKR